MGYRSQVVLAVSKEAYALLTTVIARGGDVAELFDTQNGYVEIQHNYEADDSVAYLWDSIKWYEDYPAIRAIENFMAQLENSEMEEHYRFVRVGEDSNDNEERGYGFENIYIDRSINL